MGNAEATDAIDELVARSKDHRKLRAFHKLHRTHPEVLDFLVEAIRLRLSKGFEAFSFGSLWDYARWKLDLSTGAKGAYKMNDHAAPFYARSILILHPEFNGRAECRTALADRVFGLEPEPATRPGDYARRLRWADGRNLESGWRPSYPHEVAEGVVERFEIH